MSQRELAVAAGVSEPTVSHAMAGRMVSYLTIRKFARALTVTPPLLGSDGIIGTQREREAAIGSPTVAASDGGHAHAAPVTL
jgi:transcriptional regulator with XRE-family HTH domain